MFKKIIKNNDK